MIKLNKAPTFARRLYEMGCQNTWFPNEIKLSEEAKEYQSLTDMEKHYIKYMLGFFCTAESLVADNIIHALYKAIDDADCKMFLLRQAYEEANHTMTFNYIIESLGLDRGELYAMVETSPSIKAKAEFEQRSTNTLASFHKMNVPSGENYNACLFSNLFDFYAIMEGLYFFSGFLIALSFGKRQKLKGIATLISYILRDETVHLGFGMQLMRQILDESPKLLDKVCVSPFSEEIGSDNHTIRDHVQVSMKKGVELEAAYAEEAMPEGILGLNSKYYLQYCQHIADRRMKALKLEPIYNVKNPAVWLTAQTDLPELVSFFEATLNY